MFLNGHELNPYLLNTKRRLCGYTQVQLANRCAVHQSRISLIESNDAIRKDKDKKKIESFLGKIIWENLTVNDGVGGYGGGYDMNPKEISGDPEVGIKVRINKNPDTLPCPKVLHIGAEEDQNLYRYLSCDEYIQEK